MNSPLNLTPKDQCRLNEAAIDRFHELYPVPQGAIVLLTLDGRLLLTAKKPEHVDWLIDEAEILKHVARLVFGAIEVSIWFAEVEVCRDGTMPSSECAVHLKESTLSDDPMPPTTLERPATEAPAIAPASIAAIPDVEIPKYVPIADLAAQMSVLLNRPIDEIKQEWYKNEPMLFINSATAAEMIDKQIGQLQAMRDRLVQRVPVSAPATNGSMPATAPAAKKPTATKAKSTAQRKSRAKPKPAPAPEISA